MLRYTILACILCLASGFTFKRPDPLCDAKDYKCIIGIVTNLFHSSLNGIEEIGVVPLDPLYLEYVEKRLPEAELYLTNSTVIGFKETIINEVTMTKNETQKYLRYDITLPHYAMSGNFKLNGKIIDVVLEGEGKYSINTTNLHIFGVVLKDFFAKDGKIHLKLTHIKSEIEILGDVHMIHQFNGNNSIPKPLLEFLNKNTKLLTKIWQDTVNLANMNKVFDDFNKILETVPINELITGTK